MWKCIRCEKENQDTEEICTGVRTTAGRWIISVTEPWRKSPYLCLRTEKSQQRGSREFVQKKLTDLVLLCRRQKKKISDAQNEINTLNGEVQERNKIIEKNEKIDRVRKTYGNGLSVVTAIVGILFWVYLIYQSALGNKESTGIEYIKQNVISFVVCAIFLR